MIYKWQSISQQYFQAHIIFQDFQDDPKYVLKWFQLILVIIQSRIESRLILIGLSSTFDYIFFIDRPINI